MREKDGRPPQSLDAWRSFHARVELAARFPSVLDFVQMLAVANIDAKTVKVELEKVLAELRSGPGRSLEPLPGRPGLNERRLHTAAELERLSQDSAALLSLRNAIDDELRAAEAALARAEGDLLRLSLQREPEDAYFGIVRDTMQAAGLTAAGWRNIRADDIQRIRDIVAAAQPAKASQDRPPRRKAEVALAWRADNAWVDFPRQLPGFSMSEREINPRAVDADTLRKCGLPPFATVEAFDYPLLAARFNAATTPLMKAKTCWNVCEKWIADHLDDGVSDGNMRQVREQVWTFLLAVRYDFAKDMKNLERVQFLSPWDGRKFVVAVRTG